MLETKELEKTLREIYRGRSELLFDKKTKELTQEQKNSILEDMLCWQMSHYRADVNEFVEKFGIIFNDEIVEIQEWLKTQ